MIKKFKVELEIEVNESFAKKENSSVNQYIINELGWIRSSFVNMVLKRIKEIK